MKIKCSVIMLCIAAMLLLTACSNQPSHVWPATGLSTILPQPDSADWEIQFDQSDSFLANITTKDGGDYAEYKAQCIAKGFTIDAEDTSMSYTAYNSDGYQLILTDWSTINSFSIQLHAPATNDEITVKPDETDNSETTAQTTKATETTTTSETTSQTTTDSPLTVTTTESEPEESDSPIDVLIRPEIKEAIDSYEAFMNEYYDFMVKFNENPGDLTLLTEYTDYITRYTEAMDKIDDIGEKDLTDPELVYYMDTIDRVNKKLLELV